MSLKQAFLPEIVVIGMDAISPVKSLTSAYRKSHTYRRIAASIREVGLIEPLIVFPAGDGKYLLLDGHTRLDVITASHARSVDCLIATDNESYTYNRRVNHVPPIAQHHMILRALAHVSEERIANALDVSVASIRQKRDLLKGICPEAAEILRDERVGADAFGSLRRMKPIRQIDVAKLMVCAKKFSGRFVRALLAGTRDESLVDAPKPGARGIATDQRMLIEQETEEMLRHVDSIRAHYGDEVLQLTAAAGYINRLLANSRVLRYLGKHHSNSLTAIRQVMDEIAAKKLDDLRAE